jgi:hypothetical protein
MRPIEPSAVSTCSVTGATSPVGCQLVDKLVAAGQVVHAIGRGLAKRELGASSVWHQCDLTQPGTFPRFSARVLFHVASIWLLPDRIEQFHENGVQRLIAFSSTSRFSKANSSSPAEQAVAESLARAEDSIASTCVRLGIAYTIFRPTLIYGAGRDRNVCGYRAPCEALRCVPHTWKRYWVAATGTCRRPGASLYLGGRHLLVPQSDLQSQRWRNPHISTDGREGVPGDGKAPAYCFGSRAGVPANN